MFWHHLVWCDLAAPTRCTQDMLHRGEGNAVLAISQFSHKLSVSLNNTNGEEPEAHSSGACLLPQNFFCSWVLTSLRLLPLFSFIPFPQTFLILLLYRCCSRRYFPCWHSSSLPLHLQLIVSLPWLPFSSTLRPHCHHSLSDTRHFWQQKSEPIIF